MFPFGANCKLLCKLCQRTIWCICIAQHQAGPSDTLCCVMLVPMPAVADGHASCLCVVAHTQAAVHLYFELLLIQSANVHAVPECRCARSCANSLCSGCTPDFIWQPWHVVDAALVTNCIPVPKVCICIYSFRCNPGRQILQHLEGAVRCKLPVTKVGRHCQLQNT